MLPKRSFLALIVLVALAVLLSLVGCRPSTPTPAAGETPAPPKENVAVYAQYTQALISSTPIPDPQARRSRVILQGSVPSPLNPPPGCSFHPRCAQALPLCATEEPRLVDVGDGHLVACHRAG
jgi:oligopeptide/dipeptide ABC transporter ATP-binding protein